MCSKDTMPDQLNKNATLQNAAKLSAQIRRQQGHDRRVAAGVPCRRCWICFPETGRRDTSLPNRPDQRAAALAQPSPYSGPPPEQTFQDKALPLAEAGTSENAAALILGMSVEVFQEKVQESYGVSWSAVLERAREKTKSDLISSALRAAKLGDWKPFLALEKAGINISLVDRPEVSSATTRQPTSIEDIDAELARLDNIERSFQTNHAIEGKGVTVHSRDIEL